MGARELGSMGDGELISFPEIILLFSSRSLVPDPRSQISIFQFLLTLFLLLIILFRILNKP